MSLLKTYQRGPLASLPALAAFAMLAACSNKTEVDLSVCDGRSASVEELGYDNTCDPIVPEVCAFPFPNDFYTRPVKETETGKCVSLKSGFFGATDPSVFNRADGFSASSTILFQLPDGVDKGFPKPTDEGIASSIETSSKTIVLDAETGELIPHFAEEDKNAPTAETRALTIRPVIRLKDGHRYIVAVRGVEDSSGSVIAPSEAFLALRDGKSSDSASIEERRDHYKKIFNTLEDAGIERDSLQLAWDFTTASTESNTRMLLHMRDDGLERVRAEGHPYTITSVAGDCSDLPGNGSRFNCDPLPGDYEENIAYRIEGTFRVPNYMTAQAPGGSLILDERGLPIVNEQAPHHDQSFAMLIPRSALEEPKPLLQYGHGLFGAESQIYAGNFRSLINEHGYIFFGTRLDGMATEDAPWAGLTLNTDPDLSKTNPMFDRLHQGMMQQILLMDMVVEAFSKDADFGRFLNPEVRHYHGISQGGIMGAVYAAISPHIERAALDVMGQPYSLLLFRSVDFTPFFVLMKEQVPDANGQQLAIALLQHLWDRCEPAGYSHLLASDEVKLPGVTTKNVLMTNAPGDHQVTRLGAHVMARAMNAKMLRTGVADSVFGLEMVDETSASENSITEYDYGNPIDPPCNQPPAYQGDGLCDDPHSKLRRTESARKQLGHFLKTGETKNFCPEGAAVLPGGECLYPSEGTSESANCGRTADDLYEENDALALLICGELSPAGRPLE